jgi:hypothetical protein
MHQANAGTTCFMSCVLCAERVSNLPLLIARIRYPCLSPIAFGQGASKQQRIDLKLRATKAYPFLVVDPDVETVSGRIPHICSPHFPFQSKPPVPQSRPSDEKEDTAHFSELLASMKAVGMAMEQVPGRGASSLPQSCRSLTPSDHI